MSTSINITISLAALLSSQSINGSSVELIKQILESLSISAESKLIEKYVLPKEKVEELVLRIGSAPAPSAGGPASEITPDAETKQDEKEEESSEDVNMDDFF